MVNEAGRKSPDRGICPPFQVTGGVPGDFYLVGSAVQVQPFPRCDSVAQAQQLRLLLGQFIEQLINVLFHQGGIHLLLGFADFAGQAFEQAQF